MNHLIRQLFFILIIGIHFVTQAQNSNVPTTPIIEVLSILENRYNVSFSYADKTIDNQSVLIPEKSTTLFAILKNIENNSDLIFETLNDRFIIIKKKNKEVVLTEDLNEIFITSYLTAGISKNLDGSIKIETDKLGVLPGLIEPDVLQTVKALPGVVSTDESISNLNVRGGTHDQNLILFDGIKMYKTGHFFGLISAFNPHLKYNIKLSKSGSHPKYGEGVSSVIDLGLSNEVVNDGLKIGFGANLLNVDFTSTIPIAKNAELQLGARRSITDFLDTPTFDNYFERAFQDSDLDNIKNNSSIKSEEENFKFHDLYGKFIWDITKKDKLKIVFLNIDNDLSYKESLINSDRDQDFDSKLNQNNTTSGITYEKQWNDNLAFKAHGYYTNYELFSNNADILNEQNLLQENRVEDNGFKFDTDYKLNQKISFSSGYQYSQVAITNIENIDNPLFRRSVKEVLVTHSLFSLFSYTNNKIAFKAGARGNYFEKFDKFIIEPRLTFNYKIDNNFRLELTGDFKSQSTSQVIDLQNDFLGVEKMRWVLADDDQTPIITSEQVGLGFYYKKRNLLISAEAYLKNVDGISSRSQGFQNQFQFERDIGSYKVKGIDFLIHKKINNFNAWLSYSFIENDYFFDNLNNSKSFPNNVDITNAVNFSGTYNTYNSIEFGLGLNWHSGNPYTKAIGLNTSGTEIEFEDPNSSRSKEFLRLDSSLSYSFKIGPANAKAGISVWNILNRENVLDTYSILEENGLSTVKNISLGITPNASFRVEF